MRLQKLWLLRRCFELRLLVIGMRTFPSSGERRCPRASYSSHLFNPVHRQPGGRDGHDRAHHGHLRQPDRVPEQQLVLAAPGLARHRRHHGDGRLGPRRARRPGPPARPAPRGRGLAQEPVAGQHRGRERRWRGDLAVLRVRGGGRRAGSLDLEHAVDQRIHDRCEPGGRRGGDGLHRPQLDDRRARRGRGRVRLHGRGDGLSGHHGAHARAGERGSHRRLHQHGHPCVQGGHRGPRVHGARGERLAWPPRGRHHQQQQRRRHHGHRHRQRHGHPGDRRPGADRGDGLQLPDQAAAPPGSVHPQDHRQEHPVRRGLLPRHPHGGGHAPPPRHQQPQHQEPGGHHPAGNEGEEVDGKVHLPVPPLRRRVHCPGAAEGDDQPELQDAGRAGGAHGRGHPRRERSAV